MTALVWPFAHNWNEEVSETLQFSTDLMVAVSGDEQRRAARLSPRRVIETMVMLAQQDRTRLDLILSKNGRGQWLVPLWQNQSRLTTPAENGESTIYLNTVGREFEPGGKALIHVSATEFAAVDIATVLPDRLTLADPLELPWPRQALVFPLRLARLEGQPTTGRYTDRLVTASVTFQLTQANDLPEAFEADAGLPFYVGYPVLHTPPDEQRRLDYKRDVLVEEIDNGTGLPVWFDASGHDFIIQQYRWFLHGLEERSKFRRLIYNLSGRLKPLWVPSFGADLEMISDEAPFSNTFDIRRCGYTDYDAIASGRNYLRIELKDGTAVHKRVKTATLVSPTTERLTVAERFTTGLNAADVERISFMQLARLDQDNVEITHFGDLEGLATCQVALRSLRVPVISLGGFNREFNRYFGRVYAEEI